MKSFASTLSALSIALFLIGCGETVPVETPEEAAAREANEEAMAGEMHAEEAAEGEAAEGEAAEGEAAEGE